MDTAVLLSVGSVVDDRFGTEAAPHPPADVRPSLRGAVVRALVRDDGAAG